MVEAGSHSIVIVDASLPAPEAGSDLEVWLMRPDAEGNFADRVSLGVVDPADPGSLESPLATTPIRTLSWTSASSPATATPATLGGRSCADLCWTPENGSGAVVRYSLCDVTATTDITADWLTSSAIAA